MTHGIGFLPADDALPAEAALTVVVCNVDRRGRQQVKASFALRKGGLDGATANAIVKALADVLPR